MLNKNVANGVELNWERTVHLNVNLGQGQRDNKQERWNDRDATNRAPVSSDNGRPQP